MVEAILEAAARILEERGLEGFNTNAVAERAGASIGSLYQYFPNKDALLVALSRRERAVLRDAVVAALRAAPGTSLAADVALLAREAVRHQLARPVLARLLDQEERRLPLDADMAALTAEIGTALVTLLGRYAAVIARENLAEAAGDVVALTRGLVDAAAENAAPDPDGLCRRVTWAVVGYLTCSEAPG